ncbi:MAG: ATP-binding cassette domain-containing protein, partial [Sneathiellales bacterium]|nr:ATP-binding cassette domain-containing protein [Sneathiellales bacterium]
PSEGSVTVDRFHTVEEGREVRRRVGFVFQNPDNQIVYPTVLEDLGFGLKNLRLGKQETAAKIGKFLDQYDLTHLENRLTHQLSGGEKQMIALIGVLIMQPDHIVLDEPTTLLDLRNRNRLMATLRKLEQNIIMVTHDLDLLDDFDRVLCIHEGKVQFDGSPADVVPAYQDLCGSS